MTPKPTREERRSAGKTLRETLSRAGQGRWSAAADRPDPLDVLKSAVAHRDRDLLPIRWGRMAQSPFRFFRGSAALMAADLAPWPVTGLLHQLCGDAHLVNFGAFGKPDGSLVFDLNDFDETCRGPWEWDLKRLMASAALAGRESGHSDGACRESIQQGVTAYAASLARFADLGIVELSRVEVGPRDGHGTLAPIFAKAERDTPQKLLAKAIEDGPRFRSREPFLRPLTEEEARPFLAAFPEYRSTLGPARQQVLDGYTPACLGRRVAGCGSLGVRDVLVLCFGNGLEDPLFLEFKAQHGSVWRSHLSPPPAPSGHFGRSAAEGQHRMQTWADPFLGWTSVEGEAFLVKQWSDHKASMEIADLEGEALEDYLELCGNVLAKAHARTGDPAALAGYLGQDGGLGEALADFALRYADQTTGDWERFKTAIADGRLQAASPED